LDFSGIEFVDYRVFEKEHKRVFERIRTNIIKTLTFPYQEETVISMMDFIFDCFKKYEKSTVMFYHSTSGFYFKRSNQLYLNY
jgi:hypothetical protein